MEDCSHSLVVTTGEEAIRVKAVVDRRNTVCAKKLMTCLLIAFGLTSCGEPRAPAPVDMAEVVVYKTATCQCCKRWAQHLRDAGFAVEPRNLDNLDEVKQRVGVPAGMGSCHTAEVGGYFVEGHVPVGDIKRLLAERPNAKGLTVPRMPTGSPGMEVPSGEIQPYDVLLVAQDGSTTVFSHHGPEEARSAPK